MENRFPGRWIGRTGSVLWFPGRPDLNTINFFFKGYVKSNVYSKVNQNMQYKTKRINAAVATVTSEMIYLFHLFRCSCYLNYIANLLPIPWVYVSLEIRSNMLFQQDECQPHFCRIVGEYFIFHYLDTRIGRGSRFSCSRLPDLICLNSYLCGRIKNIISQIHSPTSEETGIRISSTLRPEVRVALFPTRRRIRLCLFIILLIYTVFPIFAPYFVGYLIFLDGDVFSDQGQCIFFAMFSSASIVS